MPTSKVLSGCSLDFEGKYSNSQFIGWNVVRPATCHEGSLTHDFHSPWILFPPRWPISAPRNSACAADRRRLIMTEIMGIIITIIMFRQPHDARMRFSSFFLSLLCVYQSFYMFALLGWFGLGVGQWVGAISGREGRAWQGWELCQAALWGKVGHVLAFRMGWLFVDV